MRENLIKSALEQAFAGLNNKKNFYLLVINSYFTFYNSTLLLNLREINLNLLSHTELSVVELQLSASLDIFTRDAAVFLYYFEAEINKIKQELEDVIQHFFSELKGASSSNATAARQQARNQLGQAIKEIDLAKDSLFKEIMSNILSLNIFIKRIEAIKTSFQPLTDNNHQPAQSLKK